MFIHLHFSSDIQSMTWRKKWDADNLGSNWEAPDVMKKYYPGGVCGYDKEGFPIWVMPCGPLDMKGVIINIINKPCAIDW